MPLALNAGNWLYFWPLKQIRRFGLPESVELALYRCVHDTLIRAHFGQALDLGTEIQKLSQAEVPKICRASMELKSGALMGLAMEVGGILGGVSEQRLDQLSKLGVSLGVSLQKFDDIGNIRAAESGDPLSEKRQEDLRNGGPTWIWGVVASTLDQSAYSNWVACFEKSEIQINKICQVLREHQIAEHAYEQASEELEKNIQEFVKTLGDAAVSDKIRSHWNQGIQIIRQIQERLNQAYG